MLNFWGLGEAEFLLMFCRRDCEDKRKYAYEKAIEAYWKHVDRYHTWMNYYALFNGALFVGFCTLLTATTKILEKCEDSNAIICLENDYGFLQILLCVIGLISAIAWWFSIQGHEKWEANWMNIVTRYERVGVYSILITTKDNIVTNDERNHGLTPNDYFKAYSTHRITTLFVFSIICGWGICLIYSSLKFLCEKSNDSCYFLLLGALVLIGVIYLFYKRNEYKLYSNVQGKYWINKDNIL